MEITSSNRPKEKLNPFLIIKDQIKAENLSETEEEYLGKLVLLSGDFERVKKSNIDPAPDSKLRRELRGITKTVSRYPTFRRRFDGSIKIILEELTKKSGGGGGGGGGDSLPRSSIFSRLFGQKSPNGKTNNHGFDELWGEMFISNS